MEFELKNKRLWVHDGGVTVAQAAIGREASIGAAVDFPTRAGIGFARD